MNLDDNLSNWADAHVFYNMFTHKSNSENNKATKEEFEWREKVSVDSLHGKLLVKNSFFDVLKNNNKIYLAHTTPNLHNILDNNDLYPSGGCLVGSIYCTPIFEENGKLRVHNLGKYIFESEAPRFFDGKKLNSTGILIIELEIPDISKNNLIGIDYLRLGKIHLDIYKQLEYLLSSKERYDLKEICVNRARGVMDYLSLASKIYHFGNIVEPKDFLGAFNSAIKHLPILGYLYFEVVSEYIMLYQDNDLSIKHNERGEFYSYGYKNLVPMVCPKLNDNFSLRQFNPTFYEIINYLKKENVFKKINEEKMARYVADRLVFLTNARLLPANYVDWARFRWDFENLSNNAGPLLGHLIHRELRTFGRYPNFYFYFDQYKALQVWNYWNHMNIVVPFNGLVPKGEVGINPAYADLKYKTYTSKVNFNDGELFLELEKEVKINIMPKLVDLKFNFMRNKDF